MMSLKNLTLISFPPLAIKRERRFPALPVNVLFPSLAEQSTTVSQQATAQSEMASQLLRDKMKEKQK